jgi:hypothetical protein
MSIHGKRKRMKVTNCSVLGNGSSEGANGNSEGDERGRNTHVNMCGRGDGVEGPMSRRR